MNRGPFFDVARSNAPSKMAVTPGVNDVGFLIVNAVLALSETARLLRTLEAPVLTRSRAGARHLMKHAAVSGLKANRTAFPLAPWL
jgi:hypothetical protein